MAWTGKLFAALAAASLLLATALGAYVSHAMQGAAAQTLDAARTAVAFQFYHGLALLAVPLLGERFPARLLAVAGWLFVAGTLLFCGGIYASALLGIGAAGRVAPAGGLAFIAGWLAVLVAVVVSRERSAG